RLPELVSEYAVPTDLITIPPDQHFYIVDQKVLEGVKDWKKVFKGADDRNASADKYVAAQVHRWMDEHAGPSGSGKMKLGTWVVMERKLYARGELLGGPTLTEAPVWDKYREQFRAETIGLEGARNSGPTKAIDFSTNYRVVDFRGGRHTY